MGVALQTSIRCCGVCEFLPEVAAQVWRWLDLASLRKWMAASWGRAKAHGLPLAFMWRGLIWCAGVI